MSAQFALALCLCATGALSWPEKKIANLYIANVYPQADAKKILVFIENAPNSAALGSSSQIYFGYAPASPSFMPIRWIKTTEDTEIAAGERALFSFDRPDSIQTNALGIIAVCGDQPDGALTKIQYTWNGGQEWRPIDEYRGVVDDGDVARIKTDVRGAINCLNEGGACGACFK